MEPPLQSCGVCYLRPCSLPIYTFKTQGQLQSHCQRKSLTELDFPNLSFEYHKKDDGTLRDVGVRVGVGVSNLSELSHHMFLMYYEPFS